MTISWTATIKGTSCGTYWHVNNNMSNQEIAALADKLSENIKFTLQKIINGKTDIDELVERAKEK